MPIYEYKCSKCGKTFECLQSVAAAPLRKCIHCRGRAERIISQSSFQFKGSGWYITDYKKAGAKSGASGKPVEKADKNAKAS